MIVTKHCNICCSRFCKCTISHNDDDEDNCKNDTTKQAYNAYIILGVHFISMPSLKYSADKRLHRGSGKNYPVPGAEHNLGKSIILLRLQLFNTSFIH